MFGKTPSSSQLLEEMEEATRPRYLMRLLTVDGDEYEWAGSPHRDIVSRTGAVWITEEDGSYLIVPPHRIHSIRFQRDAAD